MDYASTNMACTVIGDVLVAVHGKDAPSDQDWSAYLNLAKAMLEYTDQPRVLVYSLGGSPSTTQRRELHEINEGSASRVAVMVDSRMARGAVTALSWFNPSIKAFDLRQIDLAMAHLELRENQLDVVRSALDRLRAAREAAA